MVSSFYNLGATSGSGPSTTNTTLGRRFYTTCSGNVNGVSFWKIAGDASTHIGTLWSDSGVSLATVTFSGETVSGWQYMPFASPYTITPLTYYRISVYGTSIKYLSATARVLDFFTAPLFSLISDVYYASGNAFPNSAGYNYWVDLAFDDGGAFPGAPSGAQARMSDRCVVGYLKGISLGGVSAWNGDSFARHLQTGVRKESVDGNPAAPCLALDYPGFWRFRWGVKAGTRSLWVNAKQVSNVAGKRPSMVVKANPAIGVSTDVAVAAGSTAGWTTVGPATVTPTDTGVLWVELWNNDTDTFKSPAFFDHIVAT